MNISGLQKTTLLDYPGHIAATIFLGGCNFCCPFCHNSELIKSPSQTVMKEEDLFHFLKGRASVLEGVCITGGEPTLQKDLEPFIEKIRSFDLLVKLDTNGYRPDVLKSLYKKGLIDYIAMDIKSGKTGYAKAAGLSEVNFSRIEESVAFLLSGSIPYEFRTTVVKGIHRHEDFEEIGPWITGCSHYYLQNYKESEPMLKSGFTSFTKNDLLSFASIVSPYVKEISLRGIDY